MADKELYEQDVLDNIKFELKLKRFDKELNDVIYAGIEKIVGKAFKNQTDPVQLANIIREIGSQINQS